MAKQPMVAVVDSIGDGGLLLPILLLLLLMLLLILLIIIIACKPWRFFSPSIRSRTIKSPTSPDVHDIERPLVSHDSDVAQSHSHSTEFGRNHALEGSRHQTDGHLSSPPTHGLAYKHRHLPPVSQLTHSDSFILDVSDPPDDSVVGQTLKRPSVANHYVEEQKFGTKEDSSYESRIRLDNDSSKQFIPKYTADQRSAGSILTLEVISGPSCGSCCSIQSNNKSKLPLTLGRVSPSDILVKDSEVSGKHAMINWNLNKLRWELVDMGSLNGTLLNSRPVHHPQTGSRHWGDPVELSGGDIITLGTTSKICVQVASQFDQVPFGVAVVSDPMSVRRGGKKLPMEDVCYYHWPLPGADQFGMFGIFDGHGGAAAASSASKIMPELVARILSDTSRRDKVVSHCDASDVLREAFHQTEAEMNHFYEGCTATVLLIWADGHDNFFAQCANVGDSACIAFIDGKQIKMTEDHRIVSYTERLRIEATGEPLKDGETRLCGLNLARMLGDKFLKQQDARFSSEPYISQVVYMSSGSQDFALLASDGFWDVINSKKAIQLVHQTRERNDMNTENSAEKIANVLLCEARAQRTKDNTSIIFLDFDTTNRTHSCKPDV